MRGAEKVILFPPAIKVRCANNGRHESEEGGEE